MSQEGVNLALFDTDLINALVLIPKLLRNTKVGSKYASDAYIKALMNKYFTDAKLTGVETKIIETAKKVAAAVSINIDEGGNSIRLNTAEIVVMLSMLLIILRVYIKMNLNGNQICNLLQML